MTILNVISLVVISFVNNKTYDSK